MVVNTPGTARSLRAAIMLCLGLLMCGTAATSRAQEPESLQEHFAGALKAAERSLVLVTSRPSRCDTSDPAADPQPAFHNTGFFVGERGQVLTTLLGVAGCADVRVVYRAPDGSVRQVPARVEALDQAAGLALLDCDLQDTVPIALAESGPEAGDMLALASCNSDARLMMQPGLVMPRREDLRLNGTAWTDLPLTVLYVKPGAAAAPLLDPRGRLRAVVLAVRARGQELPDAGLCYLLPADRLRPVLEDMKKGRSRRLGWLGLSVVREPEDREGVMVAGVLEESPAARAGIRPADEILEVSGRVIENQQDFAQSVAGAEPEQPLTIKLRRGDRIVTAEPRVGARPLLICSSPPIPNTPGPARVPPAEAFRRLREENERLRRELQRLRRSHSE